MGVEFTGNHSNNPPAFIANVRCVSRPCEIVGGQSDSQIFVILNLDEHLSLITRRTDWNT